MLCSLSISASCCPSVTVLLFFSGADLRTAPIAFLHSVSSGFLSFTRWLHKKYQVPLPALPALNADMYRSTIMGELSSFGHFIKYVYVMSNFHCILSLTAHSKTRSTQEATITDIYYA